MRQLPFPLWLNFLEFWLNLQTRHDLEVTEDMLEDRLEDEIHVLQIQTG